VTEATALSMPTATPESTAVANAANQALRMLNPTPETVTGALDQQAAPVAKQSAATNVVKAAPAIEPLRIIEIVLLVLAVALGIATVVVHRKQA
jgi:hypothetical protein